MEKKQDMQEKGRNKAAVPSEGLEDLLNTISPGVELGLMAAPPHGGLIQFSQDRLQHTYILGKTGTGKSTLIKQMASQDIKQGRSITVIDPHGDVADYLVATMPEQRLRDAVFLDFSDTEYLPVINPLDVDPADTAAVDRTIQDVIVLLKNGCFNQFAGPRFENFARMGLKTLFDSGYHYERTITRLADLYLNESFRDIVLAEVKDRRIWRQWQLDKRSASSNEYADTRNWFIAKFDELLNNAVLRRVLSGEHSTVNIEQTIAENKILIIKIPELVIGTSVADFLGTYVVAQIRNAVMRRSLQGIDACEPHYVYIDEFQRFASNDFATLLAESRKFKTGFILAHQNLAQLRSYNQAINAMDVQLFETLLGNVGTVVCLRVGMTDARVLGEALGINAEFLQRMKKYTAFVRLLFDNEELPPEQVTLLPPAGAYAAKAHERLVKRMKRRGIWMKEQLSERGAEIV